MIDASEFRLTYTPNCGTSLAVQRQAHRYNYSVTQDMSVGANGFRL